MSSSTATARCGILANIPGWRDKAIQDSAGGAIPLAGPSDIGVFACILLTTTLTFDLAFNHERNYCLKEAEELKPVLLEPGS
ncbi:hypothetical protein [Enterobacter hormaechei]|uniref:hypothetical protein n=1 Tax=Enterobacter hormaechei TaxID=158836 RepID=UPI0039B0E79D